MHITCLINENFLSSFLPRDNLCVFTFIPQGGQEDMEVESDDGQQEVYNLQTSSFPDPEVEAPDMIPPYYPYLFNSYAPNYAWNYDLNYSEDPDFYEDQDLSNQGDEEEEELDDRVWYRYPAQASYDEESKTLIFDNFPYSETALEFRSQGSIRLFRIRPSQSVTGKILHLIAMSKVFKDDYPVPVQELSLHDCIAHLIESTVIKDLDQWKLPKKGQVEGALSEKLKESLVRATTDSSTSVSSLLNTVDNSLFFDSTENFSKSVFHTLQADRLKPASSEIDGPFRKNLPHVAQQEANQEKFLRKLLVTHVKGTALLDLSKGSLDPGVLDQFETLDDLKVHCISVGRALTAATALTDTLNVSLAKEWAGVKSKIRERITQGVQPEELRSSMRESDLWVDGVWSDPQKKEFLNKARSFDALKTFRLDSNSSHKRKDAFPQGGQAKNTRKFSGGYNNRGGRGGASYPSSQYSKRGRFSAQTSSGQPMPPPQWNQVGNFNPGSAYAAPQSANSHAQMPVPMMQNSWGTPAQNFQPVLHYGNGPFSGSLPVQGMVRGNSGGRGKSNNFRPPRRGNQTYRGRGKNQQGSNSQQF